MVITYLTRPPETDRVGALYQLNVLNTPRESPFDRLVFVAAQGFRAPAAAVSLVDVNRVWFKSQVGLSMPGLPAEAALCRHVVERGDMLVVEDALTDDRFASHPAVTGAPHIRFYAGAPLIGPRGMRVGVMCVIDHRARTVSAAQLRLLSQLADEAAGLLMARVVESGPAPEWLGYPAIA